MSKLNVPAELGIVYRGDLPYPDPMWLREKIRRCERRTSVWRWRAFSAAMLVNADGCELRRAYLAHVHDLERIAQQARQTLAEMGESVPEPRAGYMDTPTLCTLARCPGNVEAML